MLILLKSVSWALNRLPWRVVQSLGLAIGLLWYHVVRIRRATVLANLRECLGESLGERELAALARRNFIHYGRTFLEMICALSWDREHYPARVRVSGLERVRDHLARGGRGGFFLGMHLGNWELEAGAVLAGGIPLDAVVKRAKNPFAQEVLEYYRSRTGMGVLYESGTAGRIMRALGRGRMVAFFLDQFMGPPIGLPVRFFGREAGTAVAIALLTEKSDVPVFPVHSYRDGSGTIQVTVGEPVTYPPLSESPEERLYQKTQAYNDVIETHVRRHPDQWLWLHRRWKPFRGEPRWKLPRPAAALTTALLAIALLGGCVSTEPNRTGIFLPPEPEVAVPDFEKVEKVKITELGPSAQRQAPAPKKTAAKKNKGKAEEAKAEALPVRVFALEDLPFEIGERTKISLNWMMLPAGTAYLEVANGSMVGDRPTLKLKGRVVSSRIVDAIYHVDNTVESLVDREALMPYRFVLSMFETHQRKETRVKFDHVRKVAHYQADRKSQKWGDRKDDRKDDIAPFSQDMFSGLFYARTLDYKMGRTEEVPIYENGKSYIVGLTPVASELITTDVGAFQCLKLKISLKLNNVLAPTGDVFLWVSDDHKKYIVKFDAKIKIGSLNGILTEIRERK